MELLGGAPRTARRSATSLSPPRCGLARGRRQRRPAAHKDRARHRASRRDRKSTRLNSSHVSISYAVFCLKQKTTPHISSPPSPHTTRADHTSTIRNHL